MAWHGGAALTGQAAAMFFTNANASANPAAGTKGLAATLTHQSLCARRTPL